MLRAGILCSILILCMTAAGQFFGSPKSFIRGHIVSDSTRQAIPYAHLFNESKRAGAITDEAGHFTLQADIGDTLVLTALGFYGKVAVAGDLWMDQDIVISLTPRIYEIEAVRIRAFKDYDDFRRQFLALELPKSQTRILRENLADIARREGSASALQDEVRDANSPQPGVAPINGITIQYRDDLLRLRYAEYLEKEKKQRVIDKKYNREIIYQITKLPEDELTEFMGFCHFSQEYLYQASEYEILVRIEEKFKEYLKLKPRGILLKDAPPGVHPLC